MVGLLTQNVKRSVTVDLLMQVNLITAFSLLGVGKLRYHETKSVLKTVSLNLMCEGVDVDTQ